MQPPRESARMALKQEKLEPGLFPVTMGSTPMASAQAFSDPDGDATSEDGGASPAPKHASDKKTASIAKPSGGRGGKSAIPLTAEEKEIKRLKHREYVKKSYQKKIHTIQTLKAQLEALEQQYHSILEENQVLTPSVAAVLMQAGGGDLETPLMRSYLQLTELKAAMQRENDELYRVNADYMKAEGRVQQLLDSDLLVPKYEPRFFIKPMPDAEYAKITVGVRDDILKFLKSKEKVSTGASVFGWTDQREVCGDEVKFALDKTFDMSAYDLMARCWPFLTSPTEFPRIYSANVHASYYPIQHINDDTMLFFRTITIDGADFVAKTVFLITRLKIDNGYLILMRSIDKDLVQFRESESNAVMEETLAIIAQKKVPKEVWAELYTWLLFIEAGPDKCHFQFGGSAATNVWFKEILFVTLRWETINIGSPILLQF